MPMTFTSKGSCEEIVLQLSSEHKDSYTAILCVYCWVTEGAFAEAFAVSVHFCVKVNLKCISKIRLGHKDSNCEIKKDPHIYSVS